MSTQPIKYPEPKIIRRLTLWETDPNSPEKERAQMTFAEKGNNLELSVWTKGPNDKGRPPVKANLHVLQVQSLLSELQNIIESSGKVSVSMEVKHARAKDPEDPNSPKEEYVQSVVRLAKNSEGVISIGLFDATDDTRSRILFPFVLDRWSGNFLKNGQPAGLDEISKMVAKSYIRILDHVILSNIEITTNEENKQRYGGSKFQQGGKTNGKSFQAAKGPREEFQDIQF